MKTPTLVICAAIVAHLAVAPAAVAQVSERTTIMMSVDATDVRWVDAHVPEMAATFLTTKIYRLRNVDGSRVLWQVCRFAYSGAGRYRCGIDVAIGSLAQIAQSDWVTVVSVDSEQVARRGFTV